MFASMINKGTLSILLVEVLTVSVGNVVDVKMVYSVAVQLYVNTGRGPSTRHREAIQATC